MAGSVNKVIFAGNLGQDPEVVSMNDGNKIVKSSVATSERWKDRNSENNVNAQNGIVRVIFNENLGRIAEQYLAKDLPFILKAKFVPQMAGSKRPRPLHD